MRVSLGKIDLGIWLCPKFALCLQQVVFLSWSSGPPIKQRVPRVSA